MPAIYLFEDSHFDRLYPLTLNRPASLLRCGARTLLHRAARAIGLPLSGILVRAGLTDVLRQQITLPVNPAVSTSDGVLLINARWLMLPGEGFAGTLPAVNSAGLASNAIAWIHLGPPLAAEVNFSQLHEARTLETLLPSVQRLTTQATLLERPWDLLQHQNAALLADWPDFGQLRPDAVSPGVYLLSPENIHLGRNVRLAPMIVLDASHGPIILEGSDDPHAATEVQPHAVITGPCYIGPGCVIRAHADIRSDCSFGPASRVGGEVAGTIFLGYANKQHHGFLGQSIIGQWANLGAGTTTSNLKNTYGVIRMPINGVEETTGRQFLGSIIADHAKLGIGTYLSTGSVIGFASHVIAPRPPKFVPSFAWVMPARRNVGDVQLTRIEFEKVVALARTVMSRRGVSFTPADHELFVRIAGDYATREVFDWERHLRHQLPPGSI